MSEESEKQGDVWDRDVIDKRVHVMQSSMCAVCGQRKGDFTHCMLKLQVWTVNRCAQKGQRGLLFMSVASK